SAVGVSKEVARERTHAPSAPGANACAPDAPDPGGCGREPESRSYRGSAYQRPCYGATHGHYRARGIVPVLPWPAWPGVDGTPALPGKIAPASDLQSLGHPGDTAYTSRRPVRRDRAH